jgi:hypothetical protein
LTIEIAARANSATGHGPTSPIKIDKKDRRPPAPTGYKHREESLASLLLASRLVQRGVGGILQPFNLVLYHQLPALELNNLQIVCGQVQKSFVQFVFENLVFAFKFNEMRQNCHSKPPRLG